MPKEIKVRGTPEEQKRFSEVVEHNIMAKEDLEARIPDWDKKDILFRSHIEETNWPYNAMVFDPRTFTAIFEKSSRLLGNKPRGRMVPREGGDALGAKINNEILAFQWDEVERLGSPMLARWHLMDMNARKYGASFGLAKWHFERRAVDGQQVTYFDGPNFRPLVNRDCLPNPSYSEIKNWFQVREYLTMRELQEVNDAARGKPVFKNLDILRQVLSSGETGYGKGDYRSSNWVSKNLSIKGLQDFLGRDAVFPTIEVTTEYRPDRWITFAPKHGLILRDIENPYQHGQIPIVILRYYPIDDDLYGLSEIEPIEKLQKAVNALINQYLDSINQSTNRILKVRPTGVQMHTLEFAPGAKWLMTDPTSDVLPLEFSATGVAEFANTYRFMIGAMQEALGESSAAISNLVPGESRRTATEIRDLSFARSARDNFNQVFLAEALKKQMGLWHMMDKQFLFDDPKEHSKIIRIVGKEALRYFEESNLGGQGLGDEAIEQLSSPETEELELNPLDFTQPLFPVEVRGKLRSKFESDLTGEGGTLVVEPEDFSGNYDYIPDVESMRLADDAQTLQVKRQMIEFAKDPITLQILQLQGYRIKLKDLMEDFFEQLGLKDADKYFERRGQGGVSGGQELSPVSPGAGGIAPGGVAPGPGGPAGLAGGA